MNVSSTVLIQTSISSRRGFSTQYDFQSQSILLILESSMSRYSRRSSWPSYCTQRYSRRPRTRSTLSSAKRDCLLTRIDHDYRFVRRFRKRCYDGVPLPHWVRICACSYQSSTHHLRSPQEFHMPLPKTTCTKDTLFRKVLSISFVKSTLSQSPVGSHVFANSWYVL